MQRFEIHCCGRSRREVLVVIQHFEVLHSSCSLNFEDGFVRHTLLHMMIAARLTSYYQVLQFHERISVIRLVAPRRIWIGWIYRRLAPIRIVFQFKSSNVFFVNFAIRLSRCLSIAYLVAISDQRPRISRPEDLTR